jgi:hypothetical protein
MKAERAEVENDNQQQQNEELLRLETGYGQHASCFGALNVCCRGGSLLGFNVS